jgi:hypothetical protein
VGGPTIYQGNCSLPLNSPSDPEGIIPGNTRKGRYDSSLCWFSSISLLRQLWNYQRVGSCRCRWSTGRLLLCMCRLLLLASGSTVLLLLLIVHTVYCQLNIMNLSLAHAPVTWDPRVSVVKAKLLPHKLPHRLIIQLLLALPFSLEWFPISILLGYEGFGKGFSLWH